MPIIDIGRMELGEFLVFVATLVVAILLLSVLAGKINFDQQKSLDSKPCRYFNNYDSRYIPARCINYFNNHGKTN